MSQISELKKDYTKEEIIKIVLSLGSQDYKENSNELQFQTVCHNHESGSYKLYYYLESQLFYCYTQCNESFDIYGLVQRNKECNFAASVSYIYGLLGIKQPKKVGFVPETIETEDWSLFRKYLNQEKKTKPQKLPKLPNDLIKYYIRMYPIEWLNEEITPQSMDKYGIRYDFTNNKIVIPHHDFKGQLVGIRGRALNQEDLDAGKKYMPMILENTVFKHPLALNLYGYYQNQTAIKRIKKIMIFEAEKSVLKCDGFYENDNFAVACCGSTISDFQRDFILSLGIKEVFIGFDKEYQVAFSKESDDYSEKILKLAYRFATYTTTYVLWDTENLLEFKDAPCDKGQEVFEHLLKHKFEVISREDD